MSNFQNRHKCNYRRKTTVSKLYCFLKLDKPGKSVSPIVSALGSPIYNLAKDLTGEPETLLIASPSFNVKNFVEFIKG